MFYVYKGKGNDWEKRHISYMFTVNLMFEHYKEKV